MSNNSTPASPSLSDQTDQLFKQESEVGSFRFDNAVARVFPDMIRRSVPGYAETVAMSAIIARRYAQPSSHVYDLGSSLGAVTLAMRHSVGEREECHGVKIFAVDNSQDMVEQAKHYLAIDDAKLAVEMLCADILQIELVDASVVTLNFVLQFIAKASRQALINNIAQGMLPGGALILSEKIAFAAHEQQLQDELHLDFKRANGYTEMEISQKRNAIENVLVAESDEVHIARLKQAGFSQVIRWYQCFNFVSYLAIK